MSATLSPVRSRGEPALDVLIKPFQPALGAVVTGFRFAGKVPRVLQRTFLRALLDRGLLIFEPGSLDHSQFMDFVKIFGTPVLYSGPHTPAAAGAPLANVVDSVNDDHLRNHVWHVDGTFRAGPNKFSALSFRKPAAILSSAMLRLPTSFSTRCLRPISKR
jgi:alpha-ketoglutarate-dependent taurine dioxygenase